MNLSLLKDQERLTGLIDMKLVNELKNEMKSACGFKN